MSVQDLIERHLVVPGTHQKVQVRGDKIICQKGDFKGVFSENVAVMLERLPRSYFDDKHHVMVERRSQKEGDWNIAYKQQIVFIEEVIRSSKIIVDIGCGPEISYHKPKESTLIGMDYSYSSIAANDKVDLRVCASATQMPFADKSVDTAIAIYALHHMTGKSTKETVNMATAALSEMARIVRPGGHILIIEMAPISPFGIIQDLFWNISKNILGDALDQFFWTPARLEHRCRGDIWDHQAAISQFKSSPFELFPPIFSLPRLKIPRFLYPLRPISYLWEM